MVLQLLVTASLLLALTARPGFTQEPQSCPNDLIKWLAQHPPYASYVVADGSTVPKRVRAAKPHYPMELTHGAWDATAVLVIVVDTTGTTAAAAVLQVSVHPVSPEPAPVPGTVITMTPSAAAEMVKEPALEAARGTRWEAPRLPVLVCMAFRASERP